MSITDTIDFRHPAVKAAWAEQSEAFDWEHANRVSGIAEAVARSLGGDHRTCVMARACGVFHDIQRKGSFWEKDTHGSRSASIAEVCLKANGWDAQAIRDVTKTIAQHDLSGPQPDKRDILAVALWDADILDSARHEDETLWRKRLGLRMSALACDGDYAARAAIKACGKNPQHQARVIKYLKK